MDERDYKAMNKDSQIKQPTESELVEDILAKMEELRNIIGMNLNDGRLAALLLASGVIKKEFKNQ